MPERILWDALSTSDEINGSRIPVAPIVDSSYLSALEGVAVREMYDEDFLWPGGDAHARAQVQAQQTHGYDAILLGSQCKYGRRRVIDHTNRGYALWDEYGGLSMAPPDDRPWPQRPALAEKVQLDALAIPDFEDGRLDHIDWARNHVGPETIILGGAPEGPFSFAAYLRGAQRFMLDLYQDLTFVTEALEFATEASVQMAEALAQRAVDAIWIGDGLASGSMISPDHYERFVLPYVRQVIQTAHDHDLPTVYHICGRVDGTLEQIEATGTDVFEVDSEANAGCSLKEALSQTETLIIKGNLDPLQLGRWDRRTALDRSRKLVQSLHDSDRFVLSSGCFLPLHVPPENVTAMVKAASEMNDQEPC